MKTCPFCAEEIQDAAIKCKHCGEMLEKKQEPNAPAVPSQSPIEERPISFQEGIIGGSLTGGCLILMACLSLLIPVLGPIVALFLVISGYFTVFGGVGAGVVGAKILNAECPLCRMSQNLQKDSDAYAKRVPVQCPRCKNWLKVDKQRKFIRTTVLGEADEPDVIEAESKVTGPAAVQTATRHRSGAGSKDDNAFRLWGALTLAVVTVSVIVMISMFGSPASRGDASSLGYSDGAKWAEEIDLDCTINQVVAAQAGHFESQRSSMVKSMGSDYFATYASAFKKGAEDRFKARQRDRFPYVSRTP